MLVEFSVENCKSFKNRASLSMIPSSISDLATEAVYSRSNVNLLKAAVVYGANGSGKSNLLNAFAAMRWFVNNSSRESQAGDKIEVEPFLLNPETAEKPTMREVIFYSKDVRYRYGYETTEEAIQTEWLFKSVGSKKEEPLFLREGKEIEICDGFQEGQGVQKKTRSNALFLSSVAQWNGELAGELLEWFQSINFVHGVMDHKYFDHTAQMLKDKDSKKMVMDLIKWADLGILDMELVEVEVERDDEQLKSIFKSSFVKKIEKRASNTVLTDVSTMHNVFDSHGNQVGTRDFSLQDQESQGTQKLFNILGIILSSLMTGGVLVIDEFNTRLHPLLTRKLVELFNSKEGNKVGAQLIFTTHDTNLLDNTLLRRDEIYFTEKDQFGASHLYSLVEYKNKPRKDEAYERNYIKGKYGAIPFLGNLESVLFED